MQQQPLPLYKTADKTFDEFISANDDHAHQAVVHWSNAAGPWFVLLWGSSGVGKSHLLQAALRTVAGKDQAMMYLPMRLLREMGAEATQELGNIPAIGIDDVDVVAADPDWESALFSLFNAVHDNGGRLLIASTQNPRFTDYALADLQSRLCSGLTYQLPDLDDEQKKTFLFAQAERSNIALANNVAEYIVSRHGRNLHELSELFERLDEAALQAGRTMTIPFIKDVLK